MSNITNELASIPQLGTFPGVCTRVYVPRVFGYWPYGLGRIPEDLVRFWLGHASASVTDTYANGLREDLAWRQDWSGRAGLGFSLLGLHGVTNVVKIKEVRAA